MQNAGARVPTPEFSWGLQGCNRHADRSYVTKDPGKDLSPSFVAISSRPTNQSVPFDDYSGFDETDFSVRIPAARRRETGGRRRRCRVASDGFLSSLLERIMNSGVMAWQVMAWQIMPWQVMACVVQLKTFRLAFVSRKLGAPLIIT
ncbi:hypothetical protein EAG_11110 [Camponotus floridanus]|uniref:Uncharacterized protein n=1 Tax=Camponotus floridanus TaxID=104421 RepID=E1ZW78_CAMFO|nr:hypothetical protein EAG_11110 [Camponotus floridanus]